MSGYGQAATRALRDHFHEMSQRGGASDLPAWLNVLREARVRLVADAAGSPSARAEHQARMIERYRLSVAQKRDRLPLHVLAEDLPPLPVENLLGRFVVTDPTTGIERRFRHVARRWTRFALVGLPGGGKTTALEQLAASWSVDPSAPLPVLVPLHRLGADLANGRRVTLERLCEFGADGVEAGAAVALAELVRAGEGALLLDGLDECRSRRGAAADAISEVIDTLPVTTGVVVSARAAASPAIARLGLPVVELAADGLPEATDALLNHVRQHRAVADPDAWLQDRRTWIERARGDQPGVWRVPLLAMTLSLIAAESSAESMPSTRAAALVEALRRTVGVWKTRRASDPEAWSQHLSPGVLLDAFAATAHAIVCGDPTREGVSRAVASRLQERRIATAAEALEVGQEAVKWWTSRNGLLVQSDTSYRTRLPLLADVGDALWATTATNDVRQQWMEAALRAPSVGKESVLLAAVLNPRVAHDLTARVSDRETALLVADAVREGAVLDETDLGSVVERLSHYAISSTSGPVPGTLDERGWACMRAIAGMHLPPALQPLRRRRIHDIAVGEQLVVALAVAASTDIDQDRRPPSPSEAADLRACIMLPVPPDDSWSAPLSSRQTYVNSASPLLSGRSQATAAAARLLLHLSPGEVGMVRAVVARTPMAEGEKVLATLSEENGDSRPAGPLHSRVVGPVTCGSGCGLA